MNLRVAREEKRLTQAQVGALINRSAAFVSLAERGKRSLTPEQIAALTASLGVNEDWLVSGSGPMTDHELTRDRRSIGERLYQVRKEKKLTQKGMADVLSLSRNTISLLERNKVSASPSVIRKAVEKLDIDETWLRTGEKESRAEEIKSWLSSHPEDLREINAWMGERNL